jgi:hypothetical protein
MVALVTGSTWFFLDAATDMHSVLELAQLSYSGTDPRRLSVVGTLH